MKRRNDMEFVGKKFNRLTAIKFIKIGKGRGHIWSFKCDCGNICQTLAYYVESGHTKSCGCFQKEQTSMAKFEHGLSKGKFHNTWCKIAFGRCINPNDKSFQRYGGRGIKISDEWRKFENFKKDMYESYLEHINKFGEQNTTIERNDVNGDYELRNCRWATWGEQTRNRRSNHPLVYKGETKIMVEWAEKFNLPYLLLWKRIRRGWNVEKALETPIMVNQFKFR